MLCDKPSILHHGFKGWNVNLMWGKRKKCFQVWFSFISEFWFCERWADRRRSLIMKTVRNAQKLRLKTTVYSNFAWWKFYSVIVEHKILIQIWFRTVFSFQKFSSSYLSIRFAVVCGEIQLTAEVTCRTDLRVVLHFHLGVRNTFSLTQRQECACRFAA